MNKRTARTLKETAIGLPIILGSLLGMIGLARFGLMDELGVAIVLVVVGAILVYLSWLIGAFTRAIIKG